MVDHLERVHEIVLGGNHREEPEMRVAGSLPAIPRVLKPTVFDKIYNGFTFFPLPPLLSSATDWNDEMISFTTGATDDNVPNCYTSGRGTHGRGDRRTNNAAHHHPTNEETRSHGNEPAAAGKIVAEQ
jgi:hypothetical protein